MTRKDADTQALYAAWCEAEAMAHRIFGEVNDNYAHPHYVEANQRAHTLLQELLKPASSIHSAIVKLRIACHYEDYIKEAQQPNCTFIAPRAIIAALRDLEQLVAKV